MRPKSHYRTGKFLILESLKPTAPKFNVVKKDIDNFVKFFDSLNKHLYNDDSQIF